MSTLELLQYVETTIREIELRSYHLQVPREVLDNLNDLIMTLMEARGV